MIEIIFTSRPLSWRPISWVNAITRIKTRSPFDHVSVEYKDRVYESTAGKGVHVIGWKEWIKGRKGTYIICYQVPRSEISFHRFDELKGTKYDYPANIYYLFGMYKMLKKRKAKRMFCSELVAEMLGLKDSHTYTPDNLERELRKYNSYITEL